MASNEDAVIGCCILGCVVPTIAIILGLAIIGLVVLIKWI